MRMKPHGDSLSYLLVSEIINLLLTKSGKPVPQEWYRRCWSCVYLWVEDARHAEKNQNEPWRKFNWATLKIESYWRSHRVFQREALSTWEYILLLRALLIPAHGFKVTRRLCLKNLLEPFATSDSPVYRYLELLLRSQSTSSNWFISLSIYSPKVCPKPFNV